MVPNLKSYATPLAFRRALDNRLAQAARQSGSNLDRARQLFVFNRFLARVARHFGSAITLKGGLALELRLQRARTTKDIDLRLEGSPQGALAQLQASGRLDLGDFLRFEVSEDREHPTMTGEGMKYEGFRFRSECFLGGKILANPFGVDVAMSGPMLREPDELEAEDTLAFIGVPPPRIRVLPVETHLAEKLHAYSMPRDRPNTRVKDLPDMALIAAEHPLDAQALRNALRLTFDHRQTHPVPTRLPAPPKAWAEEYRRLSQENELPWGELDAVAVAVGSFLELVLGETTEATWTPGSWTWTAKPLG